MGKSHAGQLESTLHRIKDIQISLQNLIVNIKKSVNKHFIKNYRTFNKKKMSSEITDIKEKIVK